MMSEAFTLVLADMVSIFLSKIECKICRRNAVDTTAAVNRRFGKFKKFTTAVKINIFRTSVIYIIHITVIIRKAWQRKSPADEKLPKFFS